MRNDLGRHVLGAAAILFGAVGLAWHDFNEWQQLRSLWNVTSVGEALVYIAAIAQIAGGLAIQWHRTARAGAAVLGIVYLFFALRWIPRVIAAPLVFDNWANFFEQFSLVSAAMIVYASEGSEWPGVVRLRRVGRYCFGVCVISFTLEQLLYLAETAGFVPSWLPPGQMFWALTTTIALAAAAIAILSGVWALAASQLLTAMFVIFELLLWLPRLIANPHLHLNWGANAENLAITGAAWIVADYLRRSGTQRPYHGSVIPS
jgi:hypothetical protein